MIISLKCNNISLTCDEISRTCNDISLIFNVQLIFLKFADSTRVGALNMPNFFILRPFDAALSCAYNFKLKGSNTVKTDILGFLAQYFNYLFIALDLTSERFLEPGGFSINMYVLWQIYVCPSVPTLDPLSSTRC